MDLLTKRNLREWQARSESTGNSLISYLRLKVSKHIYFCNHFLCFLPEERLGRKRKVGFWWVPSAHFPIENEKRRWWSWRECECDRESERKQRREPVRPVISFSAISMCIFSGWGRFRLRAPNVRAAPTIHKPPTDRRGIKEERSVQ